MLNAKHSRFRRSHAYGRKNPGKDQFRTVLVSFLEKNKVLDLCGSETVILSFIRHHNRVTADHL